MGESYVISSNMVRRRRTVSDCTNTSNNNCRSPSYQSNILHNNYNSMPSILTYMRNSQKWLIFHVVCVTVISLVIATSFTIVISWNFDIFNNRKHVFLPEVGQLEISEYDEISIPDQDGGCEGDNPLGLELEAASAIHAAIEMKDQGKLNKAKKLFQHAIKLCPRHPDILTHYGEFYEETRSDLIMADHLYVQALTYAPTHSKALINRRRTSPVVEEIDERRLQRIDEKLDVLTNIPESNSALRRVKKEAYFQHLYHTVGLEGNTMSLQQTRIIVETRMAVGGKSIMEHNEILGLDEAMRFINSSLIHRLGGVSIEDILHIHRKVMSYVDPVEAGSFRRTQVYVGSHKPVPPDEIADQMQQLIEWLNSDEALSLHPVHYSAIAHYKLVHIHPFVDGNGRTSRLLMNFILMQAGYPPVIIRKQDRHLYYEHLNTANKGDIRPFIRFIADCTEKTIDVYLWASRELDKFHILGPNGEISKTINQMDE